MAPTPTERGRIEFTAPLGSDFLVRAAQGKPRRLFILLHGYQQTADYIFHKLEPVVPADCVALAANGPFPVPERRGRMFTPGFSWYFYDTANQRYQVEMTVAIDMMRALIGREGWENLPKTLIGFSQGGYIAPFLGLGLTQVDHVISLSSRVREAEIKGVPPFRFDHIHGDADDTVDLPGSRAIHEGLIARGIRGSFTPVAGVGHSITPEILAKVTELLGQ